MKRRWPHILSLVWLLVGCLAGTAAQEEAQLWLGQPNAAAFPAVRLPLRTADSQGLPITDLSRLSLRENGIPLDFELDSAPIGLDIIFVIDANAAFNTADDNSGIPRREKVADAISQFAGRFMRPDGLDRVSVIVPDEALENGRFLIENTDAPDILAQTVTAYAPAAAGGTPLNQMITLALEQVAEQADGRFQAILLFTDGGQIQRQLDYETLLEKANAANVAVYAAILGASADTNEIDNVTRLTAPTGGGYVHMPAAADADPIFLAWQAQSNQTQIVYQSLQTKSGRYPITVNLGGARASTELVLELAAPQVALQMAETTIRRTGSAHDAPLGELKPSMIELPVIVSWPDGLQRSLTAVALLVSGRDGQSTTIVEIQPDAGGQLTLDWDVQFLREGAYQIVVQAVDELGYTAESEPVVVTIFEDRPSPPTPTPLPTPVPTAVEPEPVPVITTNQQWLILGISLLAGFIITIRLWRRWRQRAARAAETQAELETAEPEPKPQPSSPPLAATLEIARGDGVTRLPLAVENVTIGRDAAAAQLVLDDNSVGRLHARIRWRDGRYLLYDEGSASGTYLNFERLGLAPRPLQDGDEIQIGRLRLRFRLGLPFDEEE